MTKVRIGVVESGSMAQSHAEHSSKLHVAEVAAIASRNRDTGTQLAQKYEVGFSPDWRDFLRRKNPIGIEISTHNDSHAEIVMPALQTDKHVLTEYPLARSIDQGESAITLAESKGRVLRTSHSDSVSNSHRVIKQKVQQIGAVLLATIWQLAPGRGARPEVLLNLPIYSPAAHFFIYHTYPIIDLFGPAVWMNEAPVYEGFTPDGAYDLFVNTVTVEFDRRGIRLWASARGIETKPPEQHYPYVFTSGTIVNSDRSSSCVPQSEIEDIRPLDEPSVSLHEL